MPAWCLTLRCSEWAAGSFFRLDTPLRPTERFVLRQERCPFRRGVRVAIMLVSRRVAPGVRAVRLVVLMPGATLVCDPFITMVSLPGTTAKAVTLSVALFAENGGAGANPRVMHTHYQTLMTSIRTPTRRHGMPYSGNRPGRASTCR